MSPTQHLVAACATLVVLTLVVGMRMLQVRIGDMRSKRIHPQAVALSAGKSQRFEDSRASDNFNHLFEVPVLFYALCLAAIATAHVPGWMAACAWLFVALRILHSAIQCSYNKVMHRFPVFLAGFFLVVAMWLAYAISYIGT